jgi:hypothetical protein
MRSKQQYLSGHPERMEWLKELGFMMHMKNESENARRWKELEDTCVTCEVSSSSIGLDC